MSDNIEQWLLKYELLPDDEKREARAKAIRSFSAKAKFDEGLELLRIVGAGENADSGLPKRLRDAVKKDDQTPVDDSNGFERRVISAASLGEIMTRADETGLRTRLAFDVVSDGLPNAEIATLTSRRGPGKTMFPTLRRRETPDVPPNLGGSRRDYDAAHAANSGAQVLQTAPALISALDGHIKALSLSLEGALHDLNVCGDLMAAIAWSTAAVDATGKRFSDLEPASMVLHGSFELEKVSGAAAIYMEPASFLGRAFGKKATKRVKMAALPESLTPTIVADLKGRLIGSTCGDLCSLTPALLGERQPLSVIDAPALVLASRLYKEIVLLRLTPRGES